MPASKKRQRQRGVSLVSGFHLPTLDERLRAVGSYPWSHTDTLEDAREECLLGSGGGGHTSVLSIKDINKEEYYSNSVCNTSFWSDLPLPQDEGSWLANVCEEGQSFDQYVKAITLRSGKFRPTAKATRAVLYLIPIVERKDDQDLVWPEYGPRLDHLSQWLSAFYCREVVVLDFASLSPKRSDGGGRGRPVEWQGADGCTGGIKGRVYDENRFQTHVDGVLAALSNILEAGTYGEVGVENGFAMVGVTMCDLYSAESDLFVAGMAAGGSKVAVLSFARYHPRIKMCPQHWNDYAYASKSSGYPYYEDNKRRPNTNPQCPPRANMKATCKSEFMRRAGKLLVHEMGHVYGLEHCIYYDCVMNGTGHLVEDFSSSAHLCGVCLRKLQFRLGFSIIERYERLRGVYQEVGMRGEVAW
eukprot:CAMPEP_0185020020 /NCGR_PEP_ID=MMETSP1103-20130426/2610_1 /TAXON_ID=36769 /ORGANISM="Paraphysomonas bandaiensis, Strain Caron Lab Isolate" /LENGTH=414 /DNA_ID=CAMNT_0027550657 /DNA_START=76 /DNA_END=1317 /DNA_ORIENTATION=+